MSARNERRSQISEFSFTAMIPGSGMGSKLGFAAHIVNISDNSTPTWNEEFDMGRPDPSMMYGSSNRVVGVSFIVVSVRKEDVEINYQLLKSLGNLTYPIYQYGRGYNAPHVMFKIGELLGGIGILNGVNYTWTNDIPWAGDPPKPILTEVDISIRVLTDMEGNRPYYNGGEYNYFGVA